MSFCTQCGAAVPEGCLFCVQCGIPLAHGAQPGLLEYGGPELHPVETESARLEGARRFTPSTPDRPFCSFCRGPLDLDGEFCQQCGAPVGEVGARVKARPKPFPVGDPGIGPLALTTPTTCQLQVSIAAAGLPAAVKSDAPNASLRARVPRNSGPPEDALGAPLGLAEVGPRTKPLPLIPQAPGIGVAISNTTAGNPVLLPLEFGVLPSQPRAVQAVPPAASAAGLQPSVPTTLPAQGVQALPAVLPAPNVTLESLEPVAQSARKPIPTAIVLAVVGVGLFLSGAAGWYFSRRNAPRAPQQSPPPRSAPSSSGSASELAPQVVPEAAPAALPPSQRMPDAVTASSKNRRAKATSPPTAPALPAPAPKAAEITNLQNLAREAYAKGNYAEPPEACAIAFAAQVLALDPSDAYAKSLLENGVSGGKYQVHQAIGRKDFAAARRTTEALGQLLPGRADWGELKTDIAEAEKAEEESRRAKAASPVLSFRVYHMHSGKAPGDKGPYCRGTLSVASGRLRYVAETALDQQLHNFEFACSEVREVKKNLRVASRENGFHVRTSTSNMNFVPEDSSASHIPALASACSR